jgi:hypothetical protein
MRELAFMYSQTDADPQARSKVEISRDRVRWHSSAVYLASLGLLGLSLLYVHEEDNG